jgi:large subunit ribosomal protein L18
LLRRIRERKTNYKKRKGMLIGKNIFTTVRLSNENVLVQMLKPSKVGDETLVSAHSRELVKHGWQGSRKNIPACYLTGLLAGKKALVKGVKTCVLYTGNRMYAPRIAASVKGVIDAGVSIPVDEETLPNQDRISGKHVADYANILKDNNQVYKARFSALLKAGFAPESYQEHFNEVKASILGKPIAKKEVKKVEAKKEVTKVEPEKKLEEKKEKEKKPKEAKKEKGKEKKTVKKKEPKGGKKS